MPLSHTTLVWTLKLTYSCHHGNSFTITLGSPSIPLSWISCISSSFSSFVLVQHNIPQLPKKLFGEINALSLKMSCHGIWLILEWVVISSPGDLLTEIKPVSPALKTDSLLSEPPGKFWLGVLRSYGWSVPVSGEGAYFPKHAVIPFEELFFYRRAFQSQFLTASSSHIIIKGI